MFKKEEIEFKEEIPKYVEIANYIKGLIEKNKIEDGEKLPTIRVLSKELAVNNVTVVNAYNKLKNEGYAYQKMGSGTYAKRKEVISQFNKEYSKIIKKIKDSNGSIIDFTGESNKEVIFPIKEFKEIINEVLDRDGSAALIAKEPLGYEKLRRTISKSFWNNNVNVEDILIISGAQQGIDIASKVILNINDNVIVEKPTYAGALSVFKWKKANIFEIEVEEDGINIEEFEKILKKNRIRCFYTMSYFHNPTGISYSYEKKKLLLELAEKYDFYIIEDDYLSDLIYDENMQHRPFKSIDINDRVIYIKSFSKVFLPGIRLGYIIPPRIFNEVIQRTKLNTDVATSSLMQRALELYITEGEWKNHIKNLQSIYEKRYRLMLQLIDKELAGMVKVNIPKGGVSIYLTINNKNIDSRELFKRLRSRNVFISPGVIFYRNQEEGINKFRISFTQANGEEIKRGVHIIREELESLWDIQQ